MSRRPWLPYALTVAVALLLVCNLAVIFAFSAESGEASGDRSAGITHTVLRLFYPDFENMDEAASEALVTSTHHFIRKAAHFSEFALLGVLSTTLILLLMWSFPNLKLRYWMTVLIPLLFCLLYAISDEVHQIFTGRGPRATDVLIDFAGAVTGFILAQGVAYLIRTLVRKRKEKP